MIPRTVAEDTNLFLFFWPLAAGTSVTFFWKSSATRFSGAAGVGAIPKTTLPGVLALRQRQDSTPEGKREKGVFSDEYQK